MPSVPRRQCSRYNIVSPGTIPDIFHHYHGSHYPHGRRNWKSAAVPYRTVLAPHHHPYSECQQTSGRSTGKHTWHRARRENWVEIDQIWLREQDIARVFVASHTFRRVGSVPRQRLEGRRQVYRPRLDHSRKRSSGFPRVLPMLALGYRNDSASQSSRICTGRLCSPTALLLVS
jgi:hypothetical protein